MLLNRARQQQQQQQRSGGATTSSPTNPMKVSVRSLTVLREFGTAGERLQMPDSCKMEFPDAPMTPETTASAGKYKRFIVHFTPPEGIYVGGTFRIEFDVTHVPDYPMHPPKVKMLTKIWHPNIDTNGAICHNYLKTDPAFHGGWTPALRMQVLVQAILTMFDEKSDSFNPEDPLNIEATSQLLENRPAFVAKAKEWVRLHAQPVPIKPHCAAY
ncbi:NEDD8-conjugating enzyme UBE2F [Pelomyxa schiedti]|nr:NEDD8-conjugating enzyme UBE2F [Pelomyxa schiedti]